MCGADDELDLEFQDKPIGRHGVLQLASLRSLDFTAKVRDCLCNRCFLLFDRLETIYFASLMRFSILLR